MRRTLVHWIEIHMCIWLLVLDGRSLKKVHDGKGYKRKQGVDSNQMGLRSQGLQHGTNKTW